MDKQHLAETNCRVAINGAMWAQQHGWQNGFVMHPYPTLLVKPVTTSAVAGFSF